MTSDNLVTVYKKKQTLIIDIAERNYNRNELLGVNPSPKKHKSRNEKQKSNTLEAFDSNSDSDCRPIKHIWDDKEAEKKGLFILQIPTKIKTGSIRKAWGSRCIGFAS